MIKVGDVCEVVLDLHGYHPEHVGRECTVVGPLMVRPLLHGGWRNSYLVRVQGYEKLVFCAEPPELKRKKPPTWDQCAWKPQEETV